MARTIAQIKREMTDRFMTEPVIIALYQLTEGNTFEQEFSPVSLESLLFDFMAFCAWTLEKLFDIHTASTQDYIDNMKPHSRLWYENMGLRFRFGQELEQDEIIYSDDGLTDEQIAAMEVVKYTSCTDRPGGLNYKVAGVTSDDLTPLTPEQHTAFQAYMARVKDAGVRLWHTNEPADSLKASLRIYYDPLVLNNQGQLISDNSVSPVLVAINDFLKLQTFNGKFLPVKFTDHLQNVQGVQVPQVDSLQARYGLLEYVDVPPDGYVPFSGYLRVLAPEDLTIEYIPFA